MHISMGNAADSDRTVPHAYPHQLALLVQQRWADVLVSGAKQLSALPSLAVLERLLSVCYQASLLSDEGRPVTFRCKGRSP